MKADWERYDKVVQRDKEGNPINNLAIDTCNLSDEKNMGIHLQGWHNVQTPTGCISVLGKSMASQSP